MSYTPLLINAHPITVAQSIATRGKVLNLPVDITGLTIEANFVVGGGGTTAIAFVQTTLDGTNYIDIMAFAFTTTSGRKILSVTRQAAILVDLVPDVDALTSDTAIDGIIGSKLRGRLVTTGTYTGTTTMTLVAKIQIR